MPTDVIVPPLGQTVDTLVLVQWYKEEGQVVQAGEPLFAVETDKATLDVEAPASGQLRQVTATPGDQVVSLSAIAVIVAAGEVDEKATAPSERVLASPRARRLAQREGVPLSAVSASGPDGAIVERDVRAYLEARATQPLPLVPGEGEPAITPVARRVAEEAGLDWRNVSGSGPAGRITREDVAQALAGSPQPFQAPTTPDIISQRPAGIEAPDTDVVNVMPMRSVRALIAQRLTQSHVETAPVTLTVEADATGIVEMRQRLAARGVTVSYNDLFLAILAKVLREHPRLNASLDGDEIKLWRRINIGLAVDTERGLMVPVVQDVDRKGLRQLADETHGLAERARRGEVAPDELRNGTFTLTNLGMYGIDAFTPIINLPETAILGVGRIKQEPVWIEDHVEGRYQVWLSLTFDHRLVDGGPAARFLQTLVGYLEEPHLLLA
jgi:pyruvate dehydrogenase E2 component (dihydrolipoamide acetyltransferase)